MMQQQQVSDTADRLLAWMLQAEFQGWDPHDGLNSPMLKTVSRLHPFLGVVALQLVKRSPLNLRPLLRVKKTVNPKGLGLVISGLTLLPNLEEGGLNLARSLAARLQGLASPGYRGACWGYPFDWPNRAFYAPQGTPTIVNTAYIGHALCDLFERNQEARWLDLADSACAFIAGDLNRTPGKEGFAFSYTPLDRSQVHNANLLGASLLSRVGKMAGESAYVQLALKSARFTIARQQDDGSWPYGEAANQRWVDSFHTGYNLLALKRLNAVTPDPAWTSALDRGYRYYLDHFFTGEGFVRFYHNRREPLDAHAFAHAIICLSEFADHPATPAGLADRVLENMMALFWSGREYFYYQRHNGLMNRLPCMRWVQAWAFLALAAYQARQGAQS